MKLFKLSSRGTIADITTAFWSDFSDSTTLFSLIRGKSFVSAWKIKKFGIKSHLVVLIESCISVVFAATKTLVFTKNLWLMEFVNR